MEVEVEPQISVGFIVTLTADSLILHIFLDN